MTPFEKAVEAGAKAFAKHQGYDMDWWMRTKNIPGRHDSVIIPSRVIITAALSALEADGWVTVPEAITDNMRRAAYDHQHNGVKAMYSAMLSARPSLKG